MPISCSICGKLCNLPGDLTLHMGTHAKEIAYVRMPGEFSKKDLPLSPAQAAAKAASEALQAKIDRDLAEGAAARHAAREREYAEIVAGRYDVHRRNEAIAAATTSISARNAAFMEAAPVGTVFRNVFRCHPCRENYTFGWEFDQHLRARHCTDGSQVTTTIGSGRLSNGSPVVCVTHVFRDETTNTVTAVSQLRSDNGGAMVSSVETPGSDVVTVTQDAQPPVRETSSNSNVPEWFHKWYEKHHGKDGEPD
ncbi:hypothetical protein [Candidatus Sororendozoicomonas aggregata]|uniref:hypothetical protein n=1 Tax=Candidatus Sororendozoicomonas aggregata TaxID=3073239 RepID=UPI002ED45ECF